MKLPLGDSRLMDVIKSVVPALVISSLISGGTAVVNQQVQGRLLEDNIRATQDLSKVMNELRLQLGIFSERYVTREELDRKLTNQGVPYGIGSR